MKIKEMFRKEIASSTREEEKQTGAKPTPQILIKPECAHRECGGHSKCLQLNKNRIGGIDT